MSFNTQPVQLHPLTVFDLAYRDLCEGVLDYTMAMSIPLQTALPEEQIDRIHQRINEIRHFLRIITTTEIFNQFIERIAMSIWELRLKVETDVVRYCTV